MESDIRYYSRRANEEALAAKRAMTPQAREWHSQLASSFFEKAQLKAVSAPVA